MRRDRLTGAASIALGLGMAANAVLGPLMLNVIRIRESAGMELQLLGGETASLFIAAPLAIVAGALWLRGNPVAPALSIGPAGYAVYTYITFILVPDYARYAGNNERWFPLYLALVILGWTLAWRSWNELLVLRPARLSLRVSRMIGVLLVLMNGFVAIAWIGTIAATLGGNVSPEYAEHPTAFWLIRLLDLGFVIPIGIVTGAGLLRRKPWATRAAYAVGGVQALLACAVAGMIWRMR